MQASGYIRSERRENPAHKFCRPRRHVLHLQRLSQSTKWIIAGHPVWQILDCVLEIRPGIRRRITRKRCIELCKSARVAEIDHGWGDFLQAVALADHP